MRLVKPMKLLSSCCRKCRWFENKTSAKKRRVVLTRSSFGVCRTMGNDRELFDIPVLNESVPCPNFVFKPCSGAGDTYIVINTMSGEVLYTTPVIVEARRIVAQYNNPSIIVAKLTKVD